MSPWILFGIITGLIVHTAYPYHQKGGVMGAAVLAGFGALIGSVLAA